MNATHTTPSLAPESRDLYTGPECCHETRDRLDYERTANGSHRGDARCKCGTIVDTARIDAARGEGQS